MDRLIARLVLLVLQQAITSLKYAVIFLCPCCCRRPGGLPGPRRALCRPPPCEAAAGLYLVLLVSLPVHFLLYSSIMASNPFLHSC